MIKELEGNQVISLQRKHLSPTIWCENTLFDSLYFQSHSALNAPIKIHPTTDLNALTTSVRARTSSGLTLRRAAGPSSLIGPIAASWHTCSKGKDEDYDEDKIKRKKGERESTAQRVKRYLSPSPSSYDLGYCFIQSTKYSPLPLWDLTLSNPQSAVRP